VLEQGLRLFGTAAKKREREKTKCCRRGHARAPFESGGKEKGALPGGHREKLLKGERRASSPRPCFEFSELY